MPQLDDLLKERKTKKFIKKDYRPWDLTGNKALPLNESKEDAINPLSGMKNVDQEPPLKEGSKQQSELVINSQSKTIGTKQGKSPPIIKGSINTIDQPYLSTLSINTIDQPLITKGSINTVYNPLSICLADLRSNPLRLIKFLFVLIEAEDTEYKTRRVKLKEMMISLNISKDSARTALRFLLKTNALTRIEYQSGAHGWSKYKIEKRLADEIKSGIKKGGIDPFDLAVNLPDTKGVYKRSNNSNIKQLLKNNGVIPDEWLKIDYQVLNHIGFTETQIKQLIEKNEPDIVQESINHFAYGLDNNQKYKKYEDPLTVLMGVLRKGQAWLEPAYRSPKEIAQQQLIETKRAEMQRKKDLEEEAYKLALTEWQQNLGTSEVAKIAPNKKSSGDITPQSAKLSLYFKENIWPTLKSEYIV